MSFIEDFENIIRNEELVKWSKTLLAEGEKDPLFTSYFGVNFNKDQLISVKLYFSFLNISPPVSLFDLFQLNDTTRAIIEKEWKTASRLDYMHQGFTFGLKCYWKESTVKMNPYIHFRTPQHFEIPPLHLKLEKEDEESPFGYCLEKDQVKGDMIKRYYYIHSPNNKNELFNRFELKSYGLTLPDLDFIEYTEGTDENKVNLIIPAAEKVKNFLTHLENQEILKLSRYFYDKYQLYYYGPGLRLNNDAIAIYFVPKSIYYQLSNFNSLKAIFQ